MSPSSIGFIRSTKTSCGTFTSIDISFLLDLFVGGRITVLIDWCKGSENQCLGPRCTRSRGPSSSSSPGPSPPPSAPSSAATVANLDLAGNTTDQRFGARGRVG
eukprot:936700-Prymnesium_polylepis.1